MFRLIDDLAALNASAQFEDMLNEIFLFEIVLNMANLSNNEKSIINNQSITNSIMKNMIMISFFSIERMLYLRIKI